MNNKNNIISSFNIFSTQSNEVYFINPIIICLIIIICCLMLYFVRFKSSKV